MPALLLVAVDLGVFFTRTFFFFFDAAADCCASCCCALCRLPSNSKLRLASEAAARGVAAVVLAAATLADLSLLVSALVLDCFPALFLLLTTGVGELRGRSVPNLRAALLPVDFAMDIGCLREDLPLPLFFFFLLVLGYNYFIILVESNVARYVCERGKKQSKYRHLETHRRCK